MAAMAIVAEKRKRIMATYRRAAAAKGNVAARTFDPVRRGRVARVRQTVQPGMPPVKLKINSARTIVVTTT
jgi:hypothetical protein